MAKIILIAVLICLCLGLTLGAYWLDQRLLSPSARQTEIPDELVVEQGVVIVPSNARGILGPGDLYLHPSPIDNPTLAGTLTDADGKRHFWLPSALPPTLANLTLEEGQEYVLRRLAACGTCEYDTAAEPLDIKVLEEMAADPNVVRASDPSAMLQFAYVNFARYALEQQARVAEAGFKSNVAIAASGDASVVGVAGANALERFATALIVIAVIGLVIFLFSRKK